MDETTYRGKRQELVEKYPLVMSSNFLRGVRIAVALVGVVMVKIVSGSLPFYRNKCLYDNVQAEFHPIQRHFQSEGTSIAIEVLMILSGTF